MLGDLGRFKRRFLTSAGREFVQLGGQSREQFLFDRLHDTDFTRWCS
jgi:hypothetical protein